MIGKGMKKHWFTLLVILFFGFLAAGSGESSSSSTTTSTRKDLNAEVRFSDTQFMITNKDTYNWTNTKFKINDNFSLEAGTINAGAVYTVGMAQFAKSDGTRFNPFQMKVLNIFISSTEGTYYGASK